MAMATAALFWSGVSLHARTTTPNSGWLPSSNASYHDNLTTPNLPFVVGARDLTPGGPYAAVTSPFAFSGTTPVGLLSVSGSSVSLATPYMSGAALTDGQYQVLRNFDLVDRLAGGFTFNLGYDFDQGRRFGATDVRADPAFAGLFAAPADFNYTGLGESGLHAGASLGLGSGISLNFAAAESGANRSLLQPSLAPYPDGVSSAFGQAQSGSVLAGVDWKFAPWAGVDFTAAHDDAQGGIGAAGAMSLARVSSNTIGAGAHLALGGGWVTSFSYNEGVTQLDQRPGNNLLGTDSMRTRSYGVAVARHGLFGDDSLGLALSRPTILGSSGIGLGTAPVDPFDGFISSNTHPILGGQSAETDLQLGYVTTFLDGALALQANAGYQMNTSGQPGNNGVAVLSRAKINF
ncbi:MAG TPA: hypothetical protein VGK90_14745 [Rhizomicrobium sp.]|jgi:hypothetical protein